MKTLVVYYSRTGITKKVAEFISENLNCDCEEIIDTKDRKGIKRYFIAGKDAATKQITEIKEPAKNSSLYDLIIIGTPVWAFTMAPAIRTYITRYKDNLKNVAFFCTQGGSGGKQTLKDMQSLCGKRPMASLELIARTVIKDTYKPSVKGFIEKLNI